MRLNPQRHVAPLADLPLCPIALWQQNPAKIILRRFFKIRNPLPIHHFLNRPLLLSRLFVRNNATNSLKYRGPLFFSLSDPALRPGQVLIEK